MEYKMKFKKKSTDNFSMSNKNVEKSEKPKIVVTFNRKKTDEKLKDKEEEKNRRERECGTATVWQMAEAVTYAR